MILYDFGPHIDAFTSERDDIVSQDVLLPKLTHSCNVEVVNERKMFLDTDALITQVPGLWIGVYSADCVPILVADTRLKVVAAIHAGWRGTVGGITRATVERMTADFGCRPEDLQAVIGPSISPEAFEVGEEVVMLFRQAAFPESIIRHQSSVACVTAACETAAGETAACEAAASITAACETAASITAASITAASITAASITAACVTAASITACESKASDIADIRSSSFYIDLWQANRWLLTEAGLREEHIQLTGLCTWGLPHRFFSARREGYSSGRIVSAICINR